MKRNSKIDNYVTLHQGFRWHVPKYFNIAEVCSRRWAAAKDSSQRIAVIEHGGEQFSYAQLQRCANQLSNALVAQGIQQGDRVGIVLSQGFACAVAYMACFQLGAIAMPLSKLFGEDAVAFRMKDSGAAVKIERVDFAALGAFSTEFKSVKTQADAAALLIYTSGTTGDPKGALIPHRALIGNLTGFVCSQNWFGFSTIRPELAQGFVRRASTSSARTAALPTGSDAIFWSPADWAWTGGLMDALLPSLYFGRPIVAYAGRFSAESAFEILQTNQVTHTFLFPTALKAMMKAVPHPKSQYQLGLRAIMSAGEAVGDAVFAYCQHELDVTLNEMFGQTEINYIVGNCAMNGQASNVGWPARAGSMGRAYPGHRVAVIDDEGKPCPVGVAGDVAVNRLDRHGKLDPIFFLGYWNNPLATAKKYTQKNKTGWCRTGDMASMDADGYLWYQGRSDDMFKAAGYRIGPSEVENCLVKHPAVANAAVVPKPDAERGALVKAYVVLTAGYGPSETLIAELQLHVRGQLAPYEYPKEIEFIDALPMTTTGKVQRRVLRLQEEARCKANSGLQINITSPLQ
ncbi:MAG: AMP-binding protein [Cytophagales bacterium]|nr:AMP-binding protein [Cytophagales bacterium]